VCDIEGRSKTTALASDILSACAGSSSASKAAAYRQIVIGTFINVFPFATVAYRVQQTGVRVYAGGPGVSS
jgi:hypothetical protein